MSLSEKFPTQSFFFFFVLGEYNGKSLVGGVMIFEL